MKSWNKIVLICAMAAAGLAETNGPRLPQGGGTIYPAWTGEYFRNTDLSGTPAYTRSEVRVRFDWETWRPILGVKAESVTNFPTDGFSARWTGKIISRFNEIYTFKLLSDEGARVKIKPESSETWTTLINAWTPHTRRTDTNGYAMATGTVYDIVVEYFDLTGDAVCELYWSSLSTPEEVIDYVSTASHKDNSPYYYADYTLQGEQDPNGAGLSYKCTVDTNGWPMQDFSYVMQSGYKGYSGRHLLSFRGKARIKLSGGVFEATGNDTLPSGTGYNSTENRTRAYVTFAEDSAPTMTATDTQRTASSPLNSGITEIALMKPTAKNGTTPHEVGEITCGEGRRAMLPFVLFRVQRNGLNEIVTWATRTLPSYSRMMGQFVRSDTNWEKLILAANEMGRDVHLCFGGSMDYDSMEKLAKLLRYGSDGVNPYSAPTANPVWPPLNPNLRVYLEHGNEMGWSSIQPQNWDDDYTAIRNSQQQPEWGVLNFDGRAAADFYQGLYRYHAYRTVRMSQAMRSAWGDAAMGDKVRVFLFGQYEVHFQNTMCQFIDDYYNNGNGNNVAEPHPVSYYLWGAGPAVYYSTTNPWGESDAFGLADCSFENTPLADGTAALRPTRPNWRFTGNSGLVNIRYPKQDSHTNEVTTSTSAPSVSQGMGYKFTVGAQDIFVYDLARRVIAGNGDSHSIAIYKADGSTLGYGRPTGSVDLEGKTAGSLTREPLRYSGWSTSDSQRVGLYRLKAGQTYIIVSSEASGGDAAPSATQTLNAGSGITIDGGITVDGTSFNGTSALTNSIQLVSGAGTGYGHVSFRYTTQTLSPVPGTEIIPPDPYIDSRITSGAYGAAIIPKEVTNGTMMAFIAGSGAIEQDITISTAGEYALQFTGVCGDQGDNTLDISMGGSNVWSNLLMGTSRKPKQGVFQWGSEYLHLEPGSYTVRIATRNTNLSSVVYFDGMHLADIDKYFGGPTASNMLGAGTATSQTDARFMVIAEHPNRMAQMWGLVGCTYEGGTNPGGDWNGENVLFAKQAKWFHPYSTPADNQAARAWNSYGGFNSSYYYEALEPRYLYNAGTYQPWLAARDRAMGWDFEPTNALSISAPLTAAIPNYEGQPASRWDNFDHPFTSDGFDTSPVLTNRQWKGWAILIPTSGWHRVELQSGSGGTARLSMDDATTVKTGSSGEPLSAHVWLNKGVHAVKVKCLSGAFSITQVNVSYAPDFLPIIPTAPTALSATAQNAATVQLRWTDTSGNEAGFLIERRIGTNSYVQIADVAANTTNYTDTGLSGETLYTYRVSAWNEIGESDPSSEAAVTTPVLTPPAAPSALSATALSSSSIGLNWTDGSDNEAGFKIERRSGTSGFAQIATTGLGSTNYVDTRRVAGTAYTYRIRSYNVSGNSAYTAEASATTPNVPAPIVEEHFTDRAGTGSIGVTSWPKGSITNGLSHAILASYGGALTAATTYGGGAQFNGTGLGDSTLWFSMLVRNTVDQDRLLFFSSGAGSSSAGLGVDFTASGARANISGKMAINSVALTPANTNLIIGKLVLSSSGNETVTIWVNPTSFTDEAALSSSATGSSSLTTNGTLTVSTTSVIYPRMQGTATVFDEIRLGAELASVTPGASDSGTTAPSAPTNLVATAVSPSLINLTWNDNASDETGFLIERRSGGGNYVTVASVGANATGYSNTGLAAGTTYTYRLAATNANGFSAWSAEASATTSGTADPYDTWAQSYNLVQDETGDDDGDGTSNFLEYALRGNPTNSASGAQVEFKAAGTNGFEYIYVRRTTANSGLTYRLETSTNLVSGVWTNSGYTTLPAAVLDANFEILTNRISTVGGTGKFIRLRIEKD
jgi:hypothetical protein